MGLGIFDFCAISLRPISKDSISSPNFSCGCSYVERALRCRGSKRRALGNYYFFKRICYEFLISKCRGDWDLNLCTFWVLAFINPLSDGKSNFFCGRNAFFFGSRFYSAVLFSQVPKNCTDLDLSLLYNQILWTYSKFAVKNNFLSLCARRSHRRAALLRTLRWLLKFSKKIRRGCWKKQVGVLKRRVFRQCHFPIRHHEWSLLRSRSDFHDGNRYDYVANVASFLGTPPDSIVLVLSHSFAL